MLPASTPQKAHPTEFVKDHNREKKALGTSLKVMVHPDGELYVGDQLSFEVIAPDGADMGGKQVQVMRADTGVLLGESGFAPQGIGQRVQATLRWVWDTSSLEPGTYALTFLVSPDGLEWQENVSLLPASENPVVQSGAHWESVQTECCNVDYITGTDAERDLAKLLSMVEVQAQDVSSAMGAEFDEKFDVVFIPRVLGHGGFAAEEVAVSYLDRNYADGDVATILHHELVHKLDAQLGGELRPSLFIEGLAVYLSGGHYQKEPIEALAAALLPPAENCKRPTDVGRGQDINTSQICGLNMYLPLIPLFDHFYQSQHEISYLEAAALVSYMVDRWGFSAFSDFYRDIHPQPELEEDEQSTEGPQAMATDVALREHFGITLKELEEDYLQYLSKMRFTAEQRDDIRLTVLLYDTIRRYQLLLDPSAYFETAWLPDPTEMQEKGIVADFFRHPDEPINRMAENQLIEAGRYLQAKKYSQVEAVLEHINQVLDNLPQ